MKVYKVEGLEGGHPCIVAAYVSRTDLARRRFDHPSAPSESLTGDELSALPGGARALQAWENDDEAAYLAHVDAKAEDSARFEVQQAATSGFPAALRLLAEGLPADKCLAFMDHEGEDHEGDYIDWLERREPRHLQVIE